MIYIKYKCKKLNYVIYHTIQYIIKLINKMVEELNNIAYNSTWYILINKLLTDKKFIKIKNKKISPISLNISDIFSLTSAINLKVVFISNDLRTCKSFYDNIFLNLEKYNHIINKKTTDNLWFWKMQGCLMLNTNLSSDYNNKTWTFIIDQIIEYISTHMNNIIFVMWGGSAYHKINLINLDKHHTVISSSPSLNGANKPFQNYPPFMNYDCFSKINNLLKQSSQTPILWN